MHIGGPHNYSFAISVVGLVVVGLVVVERWRVLLVARASAVDDLLVHAASRASRRILDLHAASQALPSLVPRVASRAAWQILVAASKA